MKGGTKRKKEAKKEKRAPNMENSTSFQHSGHDKQTTIAFSLSLKV